MFLLILLGSRRSEVLEAFPTSKMRGDFFEKLIGHVADSPQLQTCCLSLTEPECDTQCLFITGYDKVKLKHANNFISDLLSTQRANL